MSGGLSFDMGCSLYIICAYHFYRVNIYIMFRNVEKRLQMKLISLMLIYRKDYYDLVLKRLIVFFSPVKCA